MKILAVRHDYPERAGFIMNRPIGRDDYTFLHFKQKMDVIIRGEHIITEADACIFFSPNEPQLFYSENSDITHNWMHFSPDAAPLLEKYAIPQNTVIYPKDTKFITRLFFKAETEFYSDHPFKEELLEGYFKEFLIQIFRNLNTVQPEIYLSNHERKLLQSIRQSALSNPEHHWTVEEMAEKMNLSSSRFHTLYKATFGISPMKDVIENRIQSAINILISTDLAVSQVGEMVGYTNPHHFIRQFKSLTGETPLNYRKNRS